MRRYGGILNPYCYVKNINLGTSLVVQWLRLNAPSEGESESEVSQLWPTL